MTSNDARMLAGYSDPAKRREKYLELSQECLTFAERYRDTSELHEQIYADAENLLNPSSGSNPATPASGTPQPADPNVLTAALADVAKFEAMTHREREELATAGPVADHQQRARQQQQQPQRGTPQRAPGASGGERKLVSYLSVKPPTAAALAKAAEKRERFIGPVGSASRCFWNPAPGGRPARREFYARVHGLRPE
ncbi:hypothetical protein BDK51DRAFT_33248 [Blyttiomyces helicus]|uniref:Uncharacterized protein n=1 Tax=Blyttiomyces helicus TaxID=388810 RepID=A0A4V1IQ68_9FUNG|nr:hypothetical protein BDK51DRAFT_33248 [Blyttiomyces helicus]|eukprot:RKO85507.1 hypothetical protein BDK51DRAFT_33248 [Blyttiomyces helicus]